MCKLLTGHKLILARFSPLLFNVLDELEYLEEDRVLVFQEDVGKNIELAQGPTYLS